MTNREKEKKIIRIKEKFNEKIKDFNSKYPEEEQKRFSDKKTGAEKVINWASDNYIKALSEVKGITELQLAQYIISKAIEFETFYINEEIKRDEEIRNIIKT